MNTLGPGWALESESSAGGVRWGKKSLPGMSCARSDLRLSDPADSPVAAAVVSHFNDCPDSHTQFCFHGTCRFLVQEEKPACV